MADVEVGVEEVLVVEKSNIVVVPWIELGSAAIGEGKGTGGGDYGGQGGEVGEGGDLGQGSGQSYSLAAF